MLRPLAAKVRTNFPDLTVRDVFRYLRYRWCVEHELVSEAQQTVLQLPKEYLELLERFVQEEAMGWDDWHWHLRHRLQREDVLDDPELFAELFPQFTGRMSELMDYIQKFDISLLPLNLLLDPMGDAIKTFLPTPGTVLQRDPFGIRHEESTVLEAGNPGCPLRYLATHKPEYATLLLVLAPLVRKSGCPIGCTSCYRGDNTRHKNQFTLIHKDGSDEPLGLPGFVEQVDSLVKLWNREGNRRLAGICDLLVSGGEPCLLADSRWETLLRQVEDAVDLRAFRVCTGVLFQGLPFRFTPEFISMFQEWREKTGKQIAFNVNLIHPDQFTPEAIWYAQQLSRAGFDIMSQVPWIRGVNVFPDDMDKTCDIIGQIDRQFWLLVGRRPYKAIVDMQESVSILTAIEIWRRVHDRHQVDSDTTRPTSFALFVPHPTGNINLSFHSLWAIQMRVDKEHNHVVYRIPHPAGNWVEYSEPLQEGVNDDPKCLERLKHIE